MLLVSVGYNASHVRGGSLRFGKVVNAGRDVVLGGLYGAGC